MISSSLLTLVLAAVASAHIVIQYPGWRGNNLITNETWPYGMQWDYPCGGIKTTNNRTYWSTKGGAVSFQPGWFHGHLKGEVSINLGYGTDGPYGGPQNMSNIMMSALGILGPSNNPYPGTICFPQVPLPANASVQAGDKATIQVILQAQHSAALYSCVDIIFADPGDPKIADVNETNCFNSTDIGFAEIYTLTIKNSGSNVYESTSGADLSKHLSWAGFLPLALGAMWVLL